jgi:RNA polymerase sigma factor (sigma-70 family)
MATAFRIVLEHLHQNGGGLSDGQLLAQFVAARDEAAFATLLRRHGPLVLGVCRRVLRHDHDAEDAFQATFLVLARKAASVRQQESLGCWLYQVAYHTALAAVRSRRRRQAMEQPMKGIADPEVGPNEPQDWRPLLDRELSRLPERYRSAVVLCDLEGKPRQEAARELGIPVGTLSSRLVTAHKRLAKRLAISFGALAGGAVAAPLLSSTARAAVGQAGAISPAVVVLMKGVLNAMFFKKLKLAVGVVVIAAAVGVVGLDYRTDAAPADKPLSELEVLRKENETLKLNLQVVLEKVRALEAEVSDLRSRLPKVSGDKTAPEQELLKQRLALAREFAAQNPDNALTLLTVRALEAELSELRSRLPKAGGDKTAPQKELLKQRLAMAKEMAAQFEKGYQMGTVSLTQLLQAKDAVLKAELDLCESDKERVAVLEKMVASAKMSEETAAAMVQSGQASPTSLLEAKLKRLEAEIALERAKQK